MPVGLEDATENLPGREVGTWRAAMWVTGEHDLPAWADYDAEAQAAGLESGPVMNLFRDHEALIAHWSAACHDLEMIQGQADPYQSAPGEWADGLPRNEQGLRRTIEPTRARLSVIRQEIRRRGLTPPPLASIDKEPAS